MRKKTQLHPYPLHIKPNSWWVKDLSGETHCMHFRKKPKRSIRKDNSARCWGLDFEFWAPAAGGDSSRLRKCGWLKNCLRKWGGSRRERDGLGACVSLRGHPPQFSKPSQRRLLERPRRNSQVDHVRHINWFANLHTLSREARTSLDFLKKVNWKKSSQHFPGYLMKKQIQGLLLRNILCSLLPRCWG